MTFRTGDRGFRHVRLYESTRIWQNIDTYREEEKNRKEDIDIVQYSEKRACDRHEHPAVVATRSDTRRTYGQ
jgi:hypothetical protein